ncbi:5'-methylthioadenosine/S-adenosylhomocysteine nucleosidase [Micromonospora sp. WMMD1120]|uniref:5'-methylthioadenosine/S-adenosylhomocysteine nucleosidase family protein n=1 Tax=Micromonospora sp. WMMD1120 TaxID=3016106 RepID=UPI002416C349|nr:5'-methylthioadenosine/S-adenosylhomocysteine nucleosidase [Micromonospora sp. WMMD1120]MDG4807173.1 5'-methylthioadenosine/S-adenosylhomocysteine nucleosidase [Micromonospora sp. WMMD1120]
MSSDEDLVVILTALDLEYEAVRGRLSGLAVRRHAAGTRFEVGRIGQSGPRVALGLVGMGNHPSAVLAERAIAEFRPSAVLFVGVAGGLRHSVALGDVVVARKIYAYHGGTSEDDGLKARPKAWEIPHEADQVAHHVARVGEWSRDLSDAPNIRVHFGAIAAGEVVQDSAISAQAQWIRQHYNDAVAIEMEAAGVAQAGHLNRALPVVVVRGISDRADGSKAVTDGQNWQPRAARHAAAFAIALAQELTIDSGRGNGTPSGHGSASMPMKNENLATGNARVGVQAGQIHGNVTIGVSREDPVDLAVSIADLRRQMKQACLDGRLDEETYAAAEAELDAAAGCLRDGSATDRGGFLVSLKRLRGLVADVSELAARLAMIIAAARGMA